MFTIDPTITDLQLKEKNLFKVLFSINTHDVATPEMSHERAISYVIFAREGKTKMSAFVGLHLLQTERKLFYRHSANPFLEKELQNVEDEARGFVEELGALLDEIDLSVMSAEDRERWINDQSLFMPPKEPVPVAAADSEPAAAGVADNDPEGEIASAALLSPVQPVAVSSETALVPPMPSPAVQPVLEAKPAAVQAAVPAAPVAGAVPSGEKRETVPQPVEDIASLQPQPVFVEKTAAVNTPVQPKSASLADTVKKLQELMQSEIRVSLAKPEPPAPKKNAPSPTGVVSRDKEALARLFTSF